MKVVKTADAFDRSAKIYQDKFMDVSEYAEPFKLFCDNIKPDNASILDIACGPGNITKYLLDRKPGYDVLGIDFSAKMLSLAQANNPTAKFRLLDCREIDKIEQKFDGITCGFCLPYLTRGEAVALIKNVAGLLKPGGVFYLSTMEEDENNKSRYQISGAGDKVYVIYHQEGYLSDAFPANNFEVISFGRYSTPDKDGRLTTDLVWVGKLR
nr:class I SAM-dependent methyltransferase [uncultured Mucilaginibacter sp.]